MRGVLPQSLNHRGLARTGLSPICPAAVMAVGEETSYHFLTLPANCGAMSPLHQHTPYGTCGIGCKAQLNESASLQKRHLWDFCHTHIYKLELNFQSPRGQLRGSLLFRALIFSAVLAPDSFPQHHLLPVHCGFHRLQQYRKRIWLQALLQLPAHTPVQLYPAEIILSKQLLSRTLAQGTSVESRAVLLETALSITALHAFELVHFQDVARLAVLERKHAVCFMSETII